MQSGVATINTIMNGQTGVDFDEALAFQMTAPQIQVQKSSGGYDKYYYLNDAYIEATDSTTEGWADSDGNYVDLSIDPGVAYWFKVVSSDADITISGAVDEGDSVDVVIPQSKFTLAANAYPIAITLNGAQMTSSDIIGADFDEALAFQTTAPQIQVQKAAGGYDKYYYLNDAYIEATDTTQKGWADSDGNYVSNVIPVGTGFWVKGTTGDVTLSFNM